MAFYDLSKRTKKIIVASINILAGGFLAFAGIFGWSLKLYQPITAIVVIILDTWLGVKWSAPEKE